MTTLNLPGIKAQIAVDRDCWTTPEWLWALPLKLGDRFAYDLDPCGNAHATVPAHRIVAPPEDGLDFDLKYLNAKMRRRPHLMVWLNGPFSKLYPWFEFASHLACMGHDVWGVAPHAPSTRHWTNYGPHHAWSLGRVDFVPPPGAEPGFGGALEHDLIHWSQGPGPRPERVSELIQDAARPRPYYMERRGSI